MSTIGITQSFGERIQQCLEKTLVDGKHGHVLIFGAMHMLALFRLPFILCDKTPCTVYSCVIVAAVKGIGIVSNDMI